MALITIKDRRVRVALYFLPQVATKKNQYKSLKGMLKSYNDEAVNGAIEFIVTQMYKHYPTSKDRFYAGFMFEDVHYGWDLVTSLEAFGGIR